MYKFRKSNMVKSMVDICVQINIYRKYIKEIFQANGKAKPCSDKIYEVLSSELDGMKKKAIQTSINRNVNQIVSVLQVSETKTTESVDDGQDNNADDYVDNGPHLPTEFVDVTAQLEHVADKTQSLHSHMPPDDIFLIDRESTRLTESDRQSSSSMSNSYRQENSQSLFALYHKETAEANAEEEISQLHNIIDKIFNRYRQEIARLNELQRLLYHDNEHSRKTSDEEISRLRENVVRSEKVLEETKKQLSEMAETISKLNAQSQAMGQSFRERNEALTELRKDHADSLEREKQTQMEVSELRSQIGLLAEAKENVEQHWTACQKELQVMGESFRERNEALTELRKDHADSLEREKQTQMEVNELRSQIGLLAEAKENVEQHWTACQKELQVMGESFRERNEALTELRKDHADSLEREKQTQIEVIELRSQIGPLAKVKENLDRDFSQLQHTDQRVHKSNVSSELLPSEIVADEYVLKKGGKKRIRVDSSDKSSQQNRRHTRRNSKLN